MSEHMITWDQDADGVVTLTMDDPQARVNTMNERYQDAMDAVVDRLEAVSYTHLTLPTKG